MFSCEEYYVFVTTPISLNEKVQFGIPMKGLIIAQFSFCPDPQSLSVAESMPISSSVKHLQLHLKFIYLFAVFYSNINSNHMML
jgi:hypothetical protein